MIKISFLNLVGSLSNNSFLSNAEVILDACTKWLSTSLLRVLCVFDSFRNSFIRYILSIAFASKKDELDNKVLTFAIT